jgi:hypothetical protein
MYVCSSIVKEEKFPIMRIWRHVQRYSTEIAQPRYMCVTFPNYCVRPI